MTLKKTTTVFVAAAMAAAVSIAAPRKAADITVSGYTGASTLANFPVLVRISPERISGFSYADCAADGADIAFADANGNALDREIDTWNPNGESLVWVRVPSLANNMVLTLTYQDSTVTAQPPCQTNGAVWAPAGYIGVWHMNESDARDSSASGYNGTASVNSIVPTEGVLGSALQFANAGQISCGNTPNSEIASGFSVECWLYVQDTGVRAFMGKNACISLRMSGQTFTLTTPGLKDHSLAMSAPTASWFHFCTTFLPSASDGIKVYRNGVLAASTGTSAIPNPSSSSELLLGNNQWTTRMYGKIDEIRLASVVHSADWAAASAATQSTPSFLTYGSMRDLASPDLLIVKGLPDEIGSPIPSYGHVTGLSVNDEMALSMPSTVLAGEGTITNRLAGWKLDSIDLDTSVRTPVRSSSDPGEAIDRCSYVHADCAEFTWLWDVRDVLGVGAPVAVNAGENYLTLSADVTGIGYTAPSATLKFAYGVSPDALVYTNVASSSVTAIGAVQTTLTRLTPGAAYYVKAILETNDEAHDVAETDVVCFQTPVIIELGGEPGLIQAKYANKWYTGEWDIAGAVDATRVLGAWAAHCGNNFAGTMPWSSADGLTSFPTWGDNTTWGYVGYMRFDNATYTFGGCMDDNVRLVIDGATVLDQTGNAFKTATWFPPNGAGWYPIEIRVGNGTGGYGPYGGFIGLGWNTTNYTTKDTSANWNKFVDPGDGSLLRTAKDAVLTVTETVAGGALSSVTIDFPEASAARTLRVAWGPVHGGDDPSDWYATGVAANVPAGATSAVWTPPADWGSDLNLVARFYFAGPPANWSDSIFWRDYSAPDITDFAVDGTGGDTLVVSGDLASFPGADCVLAVYLGDSPTSLDTAWTGLAGATRTATGDFSLTLFEPDTTSARYLEPGATYYVAVEAVSGGQISRTAVQEVTMSAAPAFALTSSSVARRTVTFTGILADVGAGTSATVTLYTGSSNSESALARAESTVVTDKQTFTITHTFPDFETTYYWQFRATAETDGGTTNFETRSAIASCKTLDTTTYTWKTSVVSGNWDDPANWTDNQYGDSLGYPQTTAATAVFPMMTDASVTFRRALSIGTLNLSANSIAVRFVQGGASTNETRLTATTLNMNGKGGAITLDGVAITSGGSTLAAYRALNLVNAANLHLGDFSIQETNDVTVANGSWLSCNQVFFGGGTITIDDATLWTRSHDYVGRNRVGGRVVFKGANPLWRHNSNGAFFFANLANANVQLDFVVPAGGFAVAPIQAPANQTYYMGNNGGNPGSSSYTVNVLDESPANFSDGTVTSPLISWPKGINKALFNEGHLPEDGAATDDAFAWGDASSYPATLGVTIHGSSHAAQLQITAAPEEVASAELSPSYGYMALAENATRTCTAPASCVQVSADKRAVCTGWKLFSIDPVTLARTLVDSGSGTTCAVTGTGGWLVLEWQWRVEYRVAVSAGANGSAAVADEWVADGAVATVTATPDAGYAFYKWAGDVDANYDKERTLTFAVDGRGYALSAVFAQVFYVSKTGSDANDGLSWATAKATIPAAVALSSTPYVLVSNGVYEITSAIQLTKGAIVEGTGDRGAVIKLTASPPDGDATRCAVYLNHADAVLRNLAVCGIYGESNKDQISRGICIDAGGLVENCSVTNNRTVNLNQSGAGIYLKAGGVVRGCLVEHNLKNTSGGGGGQGGGIHMKAGLVENCVIRNNRVADGGGNSYGGGVYVEGGTLRNSLIAGNYTQHGPDGSGVAILNGTVENCTIAGNYNLNSTVVVGLYFVPNGAPKMRNCIIWGNENVNGLEANWAAGTGVVPILENNCSYPVLPGSGNSNRDPAFEDAPNGDYRLMFSTAVNSAQTLDWMAAATDLAGNPRVFGPAPDLGCYERVASSLDCGFEVAGDGSLDTSAVSATALVAGADPDGLTFTWTFTDTLGNVVTTNGAGLSSVTLPLATGLYDVSLSVTDGATTATAVKPAGVRVFGSDVYVAPGGGNVYPYATRATAATNLLDAIVAAGDGTTVHLAPGWHKIAQTLIVSVGARLVSDEGPEATTVFGKSAVSGLSAIILSHADAVISGVTLSGKDENEVQLQQWGGLTITDAGGTLTNCVVRGHRTAQNSVSGAALRMSGGTVVDCVFSNNLLYCSGGWGGKGVINIDAGNSLIDRCLIVDNTVREGSPSHGGGVYMKSGTIRNSLIARNFAQGYGGGLAVAGTAVARNCTVVRNTSTIANGGIYAENLANIIDCLAWSNTGNGVAEDTDDPGFVDAEGGDYHLNVASAAVDASALYGIGDFDLDGMPRYSGGVADKGCFEYDKSQFSIGISYTADSNFVEDPVVFTAAATPEGTVLDESRTWWTFDGTEPSASNYGARGAVVTNALPVGIHTVRFKTIYDGETYSFDRPDWVTRYGRTIYLLAENATPAPPYGTPETAATNIMDAFSYAIDGTTLLIGDGNFPIAGGQTLERDITVRSVNGPSRTTIDGKDADRRFNIKSADVVVEGIRFWRFVNWQQGAAISMTAAGLVTNCVFDSCGIGNAGGAGVYMTAGTVVDCVFTNCHTRSPYYQVSQSGVALWADGANCLIDRCIIVDTYEKDTLPIGNGAVSVGFNSGGTIRNSVVAGSRLSGSGGIVAGKNAKVLNCTVTGNVSTTAGMTAGVAVSNATAVVRNTIFWNNVNETDGVRAEMGGVGAPASFDHCSTEDPIFVGRPGREFLIRSNSPCRDAGVTESWMTGALDVYGRPRIDKPTKPVDIGAAECQKTDGTMLIMR